MTRSPEEDCVEKMLLNAPSGGYTNYSPSIQVSIIPTPTPFQHPSQSPLQPSSKTLSKTLFKTLSKNSFQNSFQTSLQTSFQNSFQTSLQNSFRNSFQSRFPFKEKVHYIVKLLTRHIREMVEKRSKVYPVSSRF